jgi:hypothetical protein
MGMFQTNVKVVCGGITKLLEIKGYVVSQNLDLVLPDGKVLQSIHFGCLYFGQERSFTALLVNRGPYPSTFKTTIESKLEREDLLLNVPEMIIEPASDKVEPNSKIEVIFKFQPKDLEAQLKNIVVKNKGAGPVREYIRVASFTVVETGQVIDVNLSARVSSFLSSKIGRETFSRILVDGPCFS